MNSIQLLAPIHSLENRVNDYMRPFHTATCQAHLMGALQQLPKAPTFPREESSIREQVALRLLQEVIVMGAQEQEALDACLVACGPFEALSACGTTLQAIAAHKSKKKKKKQEANSVESPSILETALRTIRRWLVKGVSFPPEFDPTNSYEERCWVEQVTTTLSVHIAQYDSTHNHHNTNAMHPLIQACLESLTKLVLMFPVQISNACHALGVQLPTWAIASRYNPRLVEGSLSMALYQQESEGSTYSGAYFKLLVQQMVRSRNPDDVALGLYKYHERHYRGPSAVGDRAKTKPQPKALCHLLLRLHRQTLSSRDSSYLLRSIMISSIPRQSHATKIATAQLSEMWQRNLYPYMELSCRPILVASRRVREAFVRLLVLSPSSVLNEEWPDRLLCHCVASLLANPVPLLSQKKSSDKTRSTADSDSSSSDSNGEDSSRVSSSTFDDSDDSENQQDEALQHHAWLAKHLQDVIATWSLSVFVRQTDYRLQRHVTNFLLSGMCFLQLQNDESTSNKDSPYMSEMVSGLLEGVTVRLESSIPTIRKDGMMIAERLAQKMGQELQFEELEQDRSLEEDDEVTFLHSVMTASEFPAHYSLGKKTHESPLRSPSRLLQQQRREQPQHSSKSKKHDKKSQKLKEKEERRKRRKAKREGLSNTRILDAVCGQIKAANGTKRGAGPRDSYEDSCTHQEEHNDETVDNEQPGRTDSGQQAPSFQLPNLPKGKPPKNDNQNPRPPPSPTKSILKHKKHRQSSHQNREEQPAKNPSKYDSYDNSTLEGESHADDSIRAQAMPPQARQEKPHQTNGHPFIDIHDPLEQQAYGQYHVVHHVEESQMEPQHPLDLQRHDDPQYVSIQHDKEQERQQLKQDSVASHANIGYTEPHQFYGNDVVVQQPPSVSPAQNYLHDRFRYEQVEEIDLQAESYHADDGQHVTWDKNEYVISDPEAGKQEMYWQNQLNQQRRKLHYQQHQNVKQQMQDQHQLQQKRKTQEHERQQQAITMKIASTVPRSHKEINKHILPEPQRSPRRRADKEGRPKSPVVTTVDDQESRVGRSREGADEDDGGVAACWTQAEVEMVLESDPPKHSALSPLPLHIYPTGSPNKSPAKSGLAQQLESSRRTEQASGSRDLPSSSSEKGGDVPSFIFAMLEEDEGEREEKQAGHDTPGNSEKWGMERTHEKETIGDDAMFATEQKRLKDGLTQRRKPPLSPRSQFHHGQPQAVTRQNNTRPHLQSSLSSTETTNQKDSHTSVRSRTHPPVDPAEIDARILAAAYDHESVASSNSAPSLSVYSSTSSDYSLTLDDEQRRNEASQRATRQPKQAYAKAYEHMKMKQKNRRGQEEPQKHRSPIILDGRTPKSPNKRVLIVDPDAVYESEEDDDEEYDDDDDEEEDYDDDEDYRSRSSGGDDEDYTEDVSSTYEDEYDDEDSAWEESENRHLDAYDVEDDEEDLRETPQPRYLRDCLELLRAPESDKSAYSKHESALKWLPRIVQAEKQPADLPDLAAPLALELMRMENKFNVENFEDDRLICVIALAVAQPLTVGQRLVLLLWEDIAFMDRLDVLTVLSEAAFELSGNKELEQWNKKRNTTEKPRRNHESVTQGRQAYVKENYILLSCKDTSTMTGTDMGSIVSVHAERALGQVESKTRRWGRGRRQQESFSFRSRFGPVAHVWYYCLVGGFLQRKDNSSLWGGAVGARLLANLFVTLATIVECSSTAPGTEVLAKDLFELVWSFRTVDVAEVRMGVLVAVAASLSCLSEEVVLTMMFDGSLSSLPEGLNQIAQLDPDQSCRRLASSMAKGISGIVDSFQPARQLSF